MTRLQGRGACLDALGRWPGWCRLRPWQQCFSPEVCTKGLLHLQVVVQQVAHQSIGVNPSPAQLLQDCARRALAAADAACETNFHKKRMLR